MVGKQGQRHTIRGGGFDAVIAEVGASLVSLTAPDGRELVRVTPPGQMRSGCNGAILAPWPNRVRDGRYEFSGTTYQLAITEPERMNAAHGLVLWERWTVKGQGAEPDGSRAWIILTVDLIPQPGYPFELSIEARYEVSEHGLRWDVSAQNIGEDPAPYAVAGHPYLVADGSDGLTPDAISSWMLKIPAKSFMEVDSERLLPRGQAPVTCTPYDLRDGRLLADTPYDIALTDVIRDEDGLARCLLTGIDGHGARLTLGPGVEWVQVYTDDQGEPGTGRRSVAIEPMTAPADAFNSGQNLVVLDPGESHSVWWRIDAV